MKYTALIGDQEIQVEFEGTLPAVRARVGEREYELNVQEVEPGVFWFNSEDQSIEAAVTTNGDGYQVRIGNRHLHLELLDGRTALRRSSQPDHDGIAELRAPMPGKIVRILVEQGDTVETNQGLLVIEAMKMQNEIRSPKAGTIQNLSVEEGMTVNAGDLLVAVE